MKKNNNSTIMTPLKESLLAGNYTPVNKKIIQILGLDAAFVLCELISKHNYFFQRNMLEEGGLFYLEKPKFREEINLGRSKLDSALNILSEHGLINEITKKGRANRFRLNSESIIRLLVNGDCWKSAIHSAEKRHTPCRKSADHLAENQQGIIVKDNNKGVIVNSDHLKNTYSFGTSEKLSASLQVFQTASKTESIIENEAERNMDISGLCVFQPDFSVSASGDFRSGNNVSGLVGSAFEISGSNSAIEERDLDYVTGFSFTAEYNKNITDEEFEQLFADF